MSVTHERANNVVMQMNHALNKKDQESHKIVKRAGR
jgi:hypothetical protein